MQWTSFHRSLTGEVSAQLYLRVRRHPYNASDVPDLAGDGGSLSRYFQSCVVVKLVLLASQQFYRVLIELYRYMSLSDSFCIISYSVRPYFFLLFSAVRLYSTSLSCSPPAEMARTDSFSSSYSDASALIPTIPARKTPAVLAMLSAFHFLKNSTVLLFSASRSIGASS